MQLGRSLLIWMEEVEEQAFDVRNCFTAITLIDLLAQVDQTSATKSRLADCSRVAMPLLFWLYWLSLSFYLSCWLLPFWLHMEAADMSSMSTYLTFGFALSAPDFRPPPVEPTHLNLSKAQSGRSVSLASSACVLIRTGSTRRRRSSS